MAGRASGGPAGIGLGMPAESKPDPGQTWISANLQTQCRIRRDFDVQVDFDLLEWPPNNGAFTSPWPQRMTGPWCASTRVARRSSPGSWPGRRPSRTTGSPARFASGAGYLDLRLRPDARRLVRNHPRAVLRPGRLRALRDRRELRRVHEAPRSRCVRQLPDLERAPRLSVGVCRGLALRPRRIG